jgi:hypothetical protein
MLTEYLDPILEFDAAAAQLWERLRLPDPSHPLDKQVAAVALIND